MNKEPMAVTLAELERNRVAALKADRERSWLAEVNVAPSFNQGGIEQVPAACKMSTGEIECLYCPQIIPAKTPQRTCPVCVTKWRTAFGDDWYTLDWHTELLEAHKAFCVDRSTQRPLPMSFRAEQVTAPHETYSEALLSVSAGYQDVYQVVTALKEEYGFGKRRVLQELETINRKRAELGCSPLPVPVTSTLGKWCDDVNTEARVAAIVAELHAAGLGRRRIRARLLELQFPAPSLATIGRWISENRVALEAA